MKRLPQQPTNTRLARFVARLINRWPLAFRSTVNDLKCDLGKAELDLSVLRERYLDDVVRIRMEIRDMLRDRAFGAPHVTVRASVDFDERRINLRARQSVHFEPIVVFQEIPPTAHARSGVALSEMLADNFRHGAEHLGEIHGREVAKIIFNRTMEAYGKENRL